MDIRKGRPLRLRPAPGDASAGERGRMAFRVLGDRIPCSRAHSLVFPQSPDRRRSTKSPDRHPCTTRVISARRKASLPVVPCRAASLESPDESRETLDGRAYSFRLSRRRSRVRVPSTPPFWNKLASSCSSSGPCVSVGVSPTRMFMVSARRICQAVRRLANVCAPAPTRRSAGCAPSRAWPIRASFVPG